MRIGLVAGEASGDVLGAGLIRAIRAREPAATFEGVAGPAMVEAGCEQFEPSDSLAVLGLIEPLVHIPRLLRLRRGLVRRWSAAPPDVVVGIDAPDFNLGLEKKLRRNGVKTAHFVSPTIWAWRPGRIKTVRKAADRVLCIFPFEPAMYEAAGVDAVFVGHPRAHQTPGAVDTQAARAALGITAREVVTVMPGSRRSEISRLGATFAEAAKRIRDARDDVCFVTPVATAALRAPFEQHLREAGVLDSFTLLDGQSQQAIIAADVALQASGTAVLEAALLRKPTVAAYRVAPLSWFIGRGLRLVKVSHFTMPNFLTEEPLVPEFIQHDARPDPIANEVLALLDDPARRESISRSFGRLRNELALDSDEHAADAIIELARR
jgi:lipid-A-disaccharide synthase